MSLDQFGKIAVAEIAFYVPLILVALYNLSRHGFGRNQGWIFLFTFSLGLSHLPKGGLEVLNCSQQFVLLELPSRLLQRLNPTLRLVSSLLLWCSRESVSLPFCWLPKDSSRECKNQGSNGSQALKYNLLQRPARTSLICSTIEFDSTSPYCRPHRSIHRWFRVVSQPYGLFNSYRAYTYTG